MKTGEQDHTDIAAPNGRGRGAIRVPAVSARPAVSALPDPLSDAAEPSRFDSTNMLELSLFLMLLTFFLVLTANTSFDERRVGPVIGGIQSAFGQLSGGRLDQSGEANGAVLPTLQRGALPASGVFAKTVTAAFVPFGGDGPRYMTTSLDMRLDPGRLFLDGAAAVRADQRSLFREIGPLLRTRKRERHLAVLVPAAPSQRLDVRRAASLARLLMQAGAPAEQIAVGVKDNAERHITFRFYTMPGGAG